MTDTKAPSPFYQHIFVLLLVSILIGLIYSNTLDDEWHFDDEPNITENESAHIKLLTIDELKKNIFFPQTHTLYRPVSRVSIALNWYFGQSSTFGYHVVNICIHILTCFILYLTLLALLKTPNLSYPNINNRQFIALLAALLWAVNPIQTQAVTYIVQRMASLAALFSIAGIYFYLKLRSANSRICQIGFFVLTMTAYLLALGSKENAAMLPISLILTEICFFQRFTRKIGPRQIAIYGFALAALMIIGAFLAFSILQQDPFHFFKTLGDQYENRPFSLMERALSQPRIVVFYLSQILYPVADRLSIAHDIQLSTSLFSPWTTITSILFIAVLIAAAISQIFKHRIVSFAILFFFLNHIIESSILPLEPVFEHRNYLPTLFLFLPVACLIDYGMSYYDKKNNAVFKTIIAGFAVLLIFFWGTGTWVRNMAWDTEVSLWEDAMAKAPGIQRPFNNLAIEIGNTDPERAKQLLLESRDKTPYKTQKNIILSSTNLAVLERKEENHSAAVAHILKALELEPSNVKERMQLIYSYIHLGEFKKALQHSSLIVKNIPGHPGALEMKAFVLLKMREWEPAFQAAKKMVAVEPDGRICLINMAFASMMMKKHQKADLYIQKVNTLYPEEIVGYLMAIQNHMMAGSPQRAQDSAQRLCLKFSLSMMKKFFSIHRDKGNITWSIDVDRVMPLIKKKLNELTAALN